MQDTIKGEIHDFIMKSYKESVRNCSDRNDQMVIHDVSVIEKYFLEGADSFDIMRELAMSPYSSTAVMYIIDRYLNHLSNVASHGGYTPDEIYFISTLLGARHSNRKAYKECAEVIAQCKDEYKKNNLVFNIFDPIEKLYEFNLISRRTLNCLRGQFDESWDNDEHNRRVTVEDIIYMPKKWLYNIQNMGNKCISEILAFVNNYTIYGRIIPTKEDIKRVLENTIANIAILENNDIINMYFLSDMSVEDMCKQLRMELDYIQRLISKVLIQMCKSIYKNEWDLLDLITLSSMIDLYMARSGTYNHLDYYHYTQYIADRIRNLLSSKE